MWSIRFFSDKVRQHIEAWPVGITANFFRLTDLMESHGADLRLPHSRAMGQGQFELRCKGAEGIGRVFYCAMVGREMVGREMVGREIVILHSFIKKTPRTPDAELATARKRLRQVQHGT